MFTLIRKAHIYAPEDLGVMDILLCHDRILEMAPDITFSYPGMRLMEAEGKFAVPGLIDQHVHVTGGGGESSFKSRIREISLEDIVKSGVTTVVGVLGTDSITRSVENLVAKTKALNEEGITAYCLTGAYTYPTQTLTGSVQKDIAFINEVIGVKIAITDHRSSAPTRQELLRLATQIRQAALISGKVGELHMHTGPGHARLSDIIAIAEESDVPIKHFRPTHVGRMMEDAIRFANMGGYIDFTSGDDPKSTADKLKEAMERAPHNRITLSSDSNGSSPVWNEKKEVVGMKVGKMTTLWNTIRYMMTEQGENPERVLPLITSNVADALEIADRKGRLAPGMDGDITIFDGEWNIDTVIARGAVMMKDKEVLARGYYRED